MTNVASVTIHKTVSQVQNVGKHEYRCYNCYKLLGKSLVKEFKQLEIKCPRCRVINEV